jgi:signal transduction histidine kinase
MGSVTLRLVALLAVAIVLAVGFGVLLSRLLLRQLSLVVRTARDLGSGQLAARAEVLGADEHGELAVVLNTMAERLQASHQTLERRVEQRTEEIRRLLRDRTDFFAGLSHELRTPLAVIITQAEMVANDQKQASPAGTGAEAIQAAATQLLDLVNDILELARAEAGKVDLDLVSVELAEVAGEVQPMLERLATSAGVQLAIHIPARVPAVRGDPARLRDVLMNLVDNAIKYTPAGGAVDVTARREGNHVRVSVADTGVGIPPKVGDRIFEPFYRVRGTAPQQDQASSGLGLALSRQWIDAHGGTLTWEPRPGAGTVFSFTVPRHVRRRAPTTERQQPPATLASVGRPREKP